MRLLLLLVTLTLGALQGCAVLQPVDKPETFAIAPSGDEPLARIARQSTPADPALSGVRALPMSNYAMDARLALAARATRSIDVQYYLLQDDVTGRRLARALRDAALRGVRVRVLVDDLYTEDSDRLLLRLAAYDNVEVRLFNPFPSGRTFALTRWAFSLLDFARVNHRMHNKMFIVDGVFAIAGGRNIADEYFFHSKEGNFIDLDVLLTGEVVPRLETIFDSYWNSPRVYPLGYLDFTTETPQALREQFEVQTADALAAFPPLTPNEADVLGYFPLSTELARPPVRLLSARIEAFADDPEKVSGRSEDGFDPGTVTSRVTGAMAQTKSELLLMSPYFIPGALGMKALAHTRENGTKVVVLTNSLAANDEPLASAAYARYRKRMLQLGVQLYEMSSEELHLNDFVAPALGSTIGRSHAKVAVLDGATTFVGSMNMDMRSSRTNTELGLLVHSRVLAQQVIRMVETFRESGAYQLRLDPTGEHIQWVSTQRGGEDVYDSEPEVSFGRRLKVWLLFPFVSESLL